VEDVKVTKETSVGIVSVLPVFKLVLPGKSQEVITPNLNTGPFEAIFRNFSGDNLNNNGPSSKETKLF